MGHITWPAALVVVAFGFMLIFRNELAGFISRAKKINKEGIEAYDKPQAESSEGEEDALEEYMESYDNPFLQEQEDRIEEDLENEGLEDPTTARSALVRELAATQIVLFFERVEKNIFASQINAMRHLNSRPDGTEGIDEMRKFFEQARNDYPDLYSNYAFEQWLNFMGERNLVEVGDDVIGLTVRGREYLKWRIESGQAGPHYG